MQCHLFANSGRPRSLTPLCCFALFPRPAGAVVIGLSGVPATLTTTITRGKTYPLSITGDNVAGECSVKSSDNTKSTPSLTGTFPTISAVVPATAVTSGAVTITVNCTGYASNTFAVQTLSLTINGA